MKRLNRLIAVAAMVGLVTMIAPSWSSAAVGQTAQLRLVDLGTLGGLWSQARAINDMGDIVGATTAADGGMRAFLWRGGRMSDLGSLGGGYSEAFDINNRGEVVGHSYTADGAVHAFLWRDGHMTDLGALGAQGHASTARAINDRGEIVGDDFGPDGMRAFLWREGRMSALSLPDGADSSSASDINYRGDIVGQSFGYGMIVAVRWRDGHPIQVNDLEAITAINDRGWMTGGPWNRYDSAWLRVNRRTIPIDRPDGSTFIEASDLNNLGVVVGFTDLGAFVWKRGRMSILPSVAGERTIAADINELGQVVGFRAVSPEGVYTHAVLWTRN